VTATAPGRRLLEACVRTATTAPSLHNSQPWLFRIGTRRGDVYADPGRRLRILDPDGREQLISVGAAAFTLRVALRHAGYRCTLSTLPDPDQPDLVAGPGGTAGADRRAGQTAHDRPATVAGPGGRVLVRDAVRVR
jgi:hypothetical protein